MANTKQAEKRVRQAAVRRRRNRDARGLMRAEIKNLRAALNEGDLEKAKGLLPGAVSRIDKTAKRGTIHRNTASRYKSILSKRVQELEAKAGPS